MNLLLFPEELLERILEEVVLYPAAFPTPSTSSRSHSSSFDYQHHLVSPEAPSRTLGPSPISTPSSTPKSSPSTTRHVSPHASPTRSRSSSHAFQFPAPSSSSSSSTSTPSSSSSSVSMSNARHTSTPVSTPACNADVNVDIKVPSALHGLGLRIGGPCGAAGAAASESSLSSSSITPSPTAGAPASPTTQLDLALAPLLTCRVLSRIALPLYYRVVHLKSRTQAGKFLYDALGYVEAGRGSDLNRDRGRVSEKRRRARWIKRLVLGGVWKEAGLVVKILAELIPAPHPAISGQGMQSEAGKSKVKGKGKAKAVPEDEMEAEMRGVGYIIALRVLEVTIDGAAPPMHYAPAVPSFVLPPRQPQSGSIPSIDEDTEVFASALTAFAQRWAAPQSVRSPAQQQQENPLRHIVLRKPQNVYLTQPRAKSVIAALAQVVESAEGLESAFVAFRISDDPYSQRSPMGVGSVHQHSQIHGTLSQQQPTTQSPLQEENLAAVPAGGPITQLTAALAGRKKLRTFTTMLPSVWNEAVLRVSRNEALERIVLLGVNGMPVCAPPSSPVKTSSGSGSGVLSPSSVFRGHNSGVGNGVLFGGIGGVEQTGVGQQQQLQAGSVGSGSGQGAMGGAPCTGTGSAGGGASRRPRLAVLLPPNPVERVYAASARGVDGYHPGTGASPLIHHANVTPSAGASGYGGGAGYVPMGTGLFMNGARKHERLCELIRYGAGGGDSPVEEQRERERSEDETRRFRPSLGAVGVSSGAGLYASCSLWFAARFSGSSSGAAGVGSAV